MFAEDGTVRAPYKGLHSALAPSDAEDLEARAQALGRAFVDQGITFSLSGRERPFPLDLVPRGIAAAEWSRLEKSIVQRVTALEMFLSDVQRGPVDAAQRQPADVILSRVETTPSTRSYRYTDYWGTVVTAFDLHAPHTGLYFVGSSVVETDPTTVIEEPAGWDALAGERVVDRFTEVLGHSTYVPENAKLTKVARELRAAHDPVAAVRAAGGFVHSEMSYIPGTTGVHSSAIDAWQERSGVRHYAHLTLLVLRGMGIPSRYVFGYLHPRRNAELGETVQGESHAWMEVWTGSWWGFDPTNDVDVSPSTSRWAWAVTTATCRR